MDSAGLARAEGRRVGQAKNLGRQRWILLHDLLQASDLEIGVGDVLEHVPRHLRKWPQALEVGHDGSETRGGLGGGGEDIVLAEPKLLENGLGNLGRASNWRHEGPFVDGAVLMFIRSVYAEPEDQRITPQLVARDIGGFGALDGGGIHARHDVTLTTKESP